MAEVSVCIPTYNGSSYVGEAISSVLAQSFTDFELIVVDDSSTDGTDAVISSFQDERLKQFKNRNRLGLVGNWNKCLELARGAYVCLFHQDDIMLRENLERKVRLLREHPNVGLVYSKVEQVDGEGRLIEGYKVWDESNPREDCVQHGLDYFATLFSGENIICCPSVVTRRECYDKLGHFDSRLPFTADWEMWLRIATHYDVAYLAEPLIRYRWHGDNETRNFVGDVRGIEQAYAAKRIILEKFPERLGDAQGMAASNARQYGQMALHQVYDCYERRQFVRAREFLLFVLKVQPALLKRASDIRLAAQLFLGERGTEFVKKTKRLFATGAGERR
ncbi:MAG TPA: glycosyltransferase [Pyrinomonadaceae bacterium]|jgi:glycosyltransferase involved in cell wall biosynthesis